MATTFSFSGPQRVTEGDNITLVVTRQGDLSGTYYVDIHPLTYYTISTDQMVDASDIQGGTQRITFLPGQSRASVSFSTLSDGLNEGREFIQAGYNIYTNTNGMLSMANIGIDNTANQWVSEAGLGPWTIAVDDPGYQGSVPQAPYRPVQTPPTPAAPVSVQTVIDNSVTNNYNDNSVTNNYVNSFNQDNSVNTTTTTNIVDSYNTDNSVNTFTLTSLLTANDYSIGKNINGSGKVQGTEENDLLTGGKKNDRLYGDLGNDELIGGKGRDRFYGGLGSNVFNAGTSKSKKDADRLYIEREGNAAAADIIEAIGKSDRVYIQGSTGNLDVRGIDGGLGIYDNDVLQAIYTGNNFNASTLENQLVAA